MILCVQSEDFKKSDSAAQGQPNKCIRLQKFKSAWSFDRAIRVSPFLLNLFGPAPRFNHHHDIFGMQSSKLGLKLVGGLGTGSGLLRTRTCYDLMDLHTPTRDRSQNHEHRILRGKSKSVHPRWLRILRTRVVGSSFKGAKTLPRNTL